MCRFYVISFAALCAAQVVCGQDIATEGASPMAPEAPPAMTDAQIRERNIAAQTEVYRRAVARKAFLEKLIGELEREAKLLEIKHQTAQTRFLDLQAALSRAKMASGSRAGKGLRVTYDNSAEIARVSKLVADAKSEVDQVDGRLANVDERLMNAKNAKSTIEFSMQEQRISLNAVGVDVAPLAVVSAVPKPVRPNTPATKQLFITHDGKIIAVTSAVLKDGIWTLTTLTGKTLELEVSAITKVIDK